MSRNGQQQSINVSLKKFDMSNVKKGSIVVMIAKRRSGKSWLIKDLLYYHRDIPLGMVICPTEQSNPFYGDIMPKLFIHDEYTPDIVANFCKRQKIVSKKFKQQLNTYGRSNIDPNAFYIMDDCMFDLSWLKDINIRGMFMNGRHANITAVFALQDSLGLGPALRGQIDYVFLLQENRTNFRRRIYEHYAGMFPTFEAFSRVFDNCTENFECMVIDQTVRSNKLEDCVFWYKADQHPPFKLGAPEIWAIYSQNYNEDEDNVDDDEGMSMDSYHGSKKTPNIIVKKY